MWTRDCAKRTAWRRRIDRRAYSAPVRDESNKYEPMTDHQSRADYPALRTNGIGGFPTLAQNDLSKIPQFFKK